MVAHPWIVMSSRSHQENIWQILPRQVAQTMQSNNYVKCNGRHVNIVYIVSRFPTASHMSWAKQFCKCKCRCCILRPLLAASFVTMDFNVDALLCKDKHLKSEDGESNYARMQVATTCVTVDYEMFSDSKNCICKVIFGVVCSNFLYILHHWNIVFHCRNRGSHCQSQSMLLFMASYLFVAKCDWKIAKIISLKSYCRDIAAILALLPVEHPRLST